MKKILLLLCFSIPALAQTNVQKDAAKKLSNGSIIVGDGTAITATGTGVIEATSIPGLAINTSAPLAGGGSLSSNLTLSIPAATGSVNGYLTSTDWATFNAKASPGNYITALTGDATASGPGASALTLATVNTNTGVFGSATTVPQITVNAKGLITSVSNVTVTGVPAQSGNSGKYLFTNGTTASWENIFTGLPTNGLVQATGSNTVNATLTPSGITSLGVNTISAAAANNLTLNAGSGNQNVVLSPTGTGLVDVSFATDVTRIWSRYNLTASTYGSFQWGYNNTSALQIGSRNNRQMAWGYNIDAQSDGRAVLTEPAYAAFKIESFYNPVLGEEYLEGYSQYVANVSAGGIVAGQNIRPFMHRINRITNYVDTAINASSTSFLDKTGTTQYVRITSGGLDVLTGALTVAGTTVLGNNVQILGSGGNANVLILNDGSFSAAALYTSSTQALLLQPYGNKVYVGGNGVGFAAQLEVRQTGTNDIFGVENADADTSWFRIANGGKATFGNTTEATTGGAGALTTAGGINVGKALVVSSTTASASTVTGSGIFGGGVGISGASNIGGTATIAGVTTISNTTEATIGGAGSLKTSGGLFVAKAIVSGSTTASASTTTGSGIFAGGVGIAGAVNVGDTLNVAGTVSLTSTTDSFSSTSGAITTAGGLGVAKAINVGTTLSVGASSISGGASSMNILAGTGNSRTMSLQTTTSGGVATTFLTGSATQLVTIANALTMAGTLTGAASLVGTNSIASSTATDLTLTTAGINGLIFTHGSSTAGTVVADFSALTKTATSTTDAAIIGTSLGLTGAIWVGGAVRATSGTGSSSTSTGSIITAGGIGIAENAYIGGTTNIAGFLNVNGASQSVAGLNTTKLTVQNTTDSTSVSTGAAIFSGGLGLTKALWVGGLVNVAGVLTSANATEATNSTTAGTVVSGGLAVAKKIITASSITTGAPTAGSAAAWKLGDIVTGVALTASATSGLRVNIGGTDYTLAILTTNP